MAKLSTAFVPSSTSSNLLTGLRNREPDVWRRLVRLYGPLVHHWARQCGLQDHDAADVMQEVLHAVSSSINQFDHDRSDSSFRGWLWIITRNQIRDFIAHRDREARPAGGTDGRMQMDSLPEQHPAAPLEESRLNRRALEQIQTEFSPQVWTAFWRTAVEGDAPRDVAEDLGLTVWAVYKSKTRVLKRLREELGERPEP